MIERIDPQRRPPAVVLQTERRDHHIVVVGQEGVINSHSRPDFITAYSWCRASAMANSASSSDL